MAPDAVQVGLLEETGYLPSGAGDLYAYLVGPRGGADRGVVLLAPLAEERRASVRALVGAARELAASGVAAARIDYRGTGDSTGASTDLSLGTMVADAVAAAGHLGRRFGCREVSLAGLRLGGAVAVLAARECSPPRLALVEPVVNGADYVRGLRRRRSVRKMLTGGRSGPEGEVEGVHDLDGLALGPALLDELDGLDLVARAAELSSSNGPRPLVLQVGPWRAASEPNRLLAQALGARSALEVVRAEPFWLQTDPADATVALRPLVRFLTGSEAPAGDRTEDGDG